MVKSEFQSRSRREGAQAQEMAAQVLTGAGFDVVARNQRRVDCGITINVVANDAVGGEWLFDVSGAFTSQAAGLIRPDTMWKTLGRANVLHQLGASDRLVFLTTNLPQRGSVGDRALRHAAPTFFDAIELLPKEGKERLRQYALGRAQLPLPGFRSADQIFSGVSLSATHGARLAVPVSSLGPIPGVKANVVGLPHHIKVFLPSLDHEDQPIDAAIRRAAVARVKSVLSEATGGCTTQAGQGSWLHPVTGIMDEAVSIIESYSDSPVDPSLLGAMISTILDDMAQHTAAVVMNDVMYHFTADD
jgi:hypothetical protein